MIPVVALVGRPNVGKSTLFNRLTRSRDALVANYPGLTRDRQYGEAKLSGRRFMLIDTAGITGDEEGIDQAMVDQSFQAIDEADIVLFMVDARAGMTASDEGIVGHLRQQNKPFHLVVNKIDGVDPEIVTAEFYAMGVESMYSISATHGRGVGQMIEALLTPLVGTGEQEEDELVDRFKNVKIGIIGRPNVGKSTLVNRMLGEDRVVVYDYPGTTRDSVYIDYERDGVDYTIIDTAGVRRRGKVKETVEKFSIVKTLKAIDDSNVIVLVMDAQEGIVEQDLHLLGQAIDAGKALVIALNKWDGLPNEQKDYIKKELDRRLHFVDYAQVHTISALHGSGVGLLYGSINKAYESATRALQTNRLTQILEGAVFDNAPPMVNGRRIKLRYAHSGGRNPPLIIIHGNQTSKVPANYRRYLEKVFRKHLKLVGTPVRIEFRGNENPYEGKKENLTPLQQHKRRRQVKKQAKKP